LLPQIPECQTLGHAGDIFSRLIAAGAYFSLDGIYNHGCVLTAFAGNFSVRASTPEAVAAAGALCEGIPEHRAHLVCLLWALGQPGN
jgi:hypothetical protein